MANDGKQKQDEAGAENGELGEEQLDGVTGGTADNKPAAVRPAVRGVLEQSPAYSGTTPKKD